MNLHVYHDLARERQREMHLEAQLQQRLREADRSRGGRAAAYRRVRVKREAPSQAPALSQAE